MAPQARLTGTWTALYTPFKDDGRIDEEAYGALCERVAAAGSGLLACGTTGETPTLTVDEVRRLSRIAIEVGRHKLPVMVGTGQSSTAGTVAATAMAKELGADLALVVVPPYNKPTQRGLLAHFRAVADVGLPIVLYNVPGRTGSTMAPSTALELAKDERFVAIKEAGGSLPVFDALVTGARALGNGFAVLSGDDLATQPLMAMGGHGVVSVASNVVPDEVVALVNAGLAGEHEAARVLHERLAPLFSSLFAAPNPIPVKAAAAMLGHARPHLRLPLIALDADDAGDKAILQQLERALLAAREVSR
jgi:4-hydroxy-tetrahydrodipicolinate synthase